MHNYIYDNKLKNTKEYERLLELKIDYNVYDRYIEEEQLSETEEKVQKEKELLKQLEDVKEEWEQSNKESKNKEEKYYKIFKKIEIINIMKTVIININTLKLVKIRTNNLSEYMINDIKKLDIVKENKDKLDKFFDSNRFNKQVEFEKGIRNHPFFYKKILETNDKVILKIINLTHSSNVIKIGSYLKEGKEIIQYAPKAWCIIEMTKKEFNEMIQDITNNTEEIKKVGGKENVEKIKKN